MYTFSISTPSGIAMVNITAKVQQAVKESNIQTGICTIFVPHTTAAVTINENADPDVVSDMLKELGKIVPYNDNYSHIEGNSAAHIKSSLFGVSQQVLVEGGKLVLGTWQGIYFCEFDGPRQRKFYVSVMGE